MALAQLSTLASNYFKEHWVLTHNGTRNGKSGLRTLLNNIINKVNTLITAPELATLTVGDISGYYLGTDSWLHIDGVNPPMVEKIRMQDQGTGAWYDLTMVSGVWTQTLVT